MKPKDALRDLEVALKQFGTYNYYDKGVDEVFDAGPVTTHVKTLSAGDAVAFLIELAKHEHGEHLVNHIVMGCDDADEPWFEKVVEGCRAAELEVY